MKINIKNIFGNCSTVSYNGTTIINGRKVRGKSKPQEFDETKSEDANNIEKIVIASALSDINISASNSSKVEVHFYGNATIDNEIDFKVKLVERELRILIGYSGNCSNSNLKLDIKVPLEKTFKLISAINTSGNVILNEKVSIEELNIKTQSGNVKSYANFKNAFVKTMNGIVDVRINAKNDVDLEIITMNGNVGVELNNIRINKISTHTMNGDVRNHHKTNNEGYVANIGITTMNGNIKIS